MIYVYFAYAITERLQVWPGDKRRRRVSLLDMARGKHHAVARCESHVHWAHATREPLWRGSHHEPRLIAPVFLYQFHP